MSSPTSTRMTRGFPSDATIRVKGSYGNSQSQQLHQHLDQQRRVSPWCITEGTYVFWGGDQKSVGKLGEKRKWIGRRKRKGKKKKKKVKKNSL